MIDISILTSQRFGLSCCVFIGVTWEGTNLTKETNLRYVTLWTMVKNNIQSLFRMLDVDSEF